MLSIVLFTESGPNDLAIIFSFMKMVDPGSTVREGEFATAENAQGVDERVRALWNRALAGTRLTDATRAEFIESAKLLMEGQRVALDRVLERFTGLAERSGIPVEDVVFDDEGHGFRKKANQEVSYAGILEFLNTHMPGN